MAARRTPSSRSPPSLTGATTRLPPSTVRGTVRSSTTSRPTTSPLLPTPALTPDDLFEVVARRAPLGWDADAATGVVLHMASAIAVAGRIGLTAIGDTLAEARDRYDAVRQALDDAVREPGVAGASAGRAD